MMIFVLGSCNNSQKNKAENGSASQKTIPQSEVIKPESNQTELILQKILDLPKLQWIYHPEAKERLPVKVLETEQIGKDLKLNKFGEKVRILSLSELEKEGIKDYIIINELKIRQDTTDFELSYKIEGAGCSGKFIKENGKWEILDYSVWEN